MSGLSGKRVLVTGATRGIGRECVKQLLAVGARVVGVGRLTEGVLSLKQQVWDAATHNDAHLSLRLPSMRRWRHSPWTWETFKQRSSWSRE